MSKINSSKFALVILSVLFSAFERKKYYDFNNWSLAKESYNIRINSVAVHYINSKSSSVDSKIRALLTIATFLRSAYKLRTLLCYRLPFGWSKKRRVTIAYALLHLHAFKKVIFSIFSLAKAYSLQFSGDNSKIIFTLGFPEHSFNYVNNESDQVGSSFAEYINHHFTYNQKHDFVLVSIDEYVRHSKLKASLLVNSNENPPIHNLDRYLVRKTISFKVFFKNFIQAFVLFFSEYRSFAAVELFEYSARINLIPYYRLFETVTQQIDSIYILPFSDFEYFNFDEEHSKKIKTFYYSENMLIPPFRSLLDIDSSGRRYPCGNFGSFGAYGELVGFTEVATQLKNISSSIFCQSDVVEKSSAEYPCSLGFETSANLVIEDGCFAIAIFDVPPESERAQLERSVLGDMTADFDFIDSFLADFMDINPSQNFVILYKPKYSLSNYSQEYKRRIDSLINKFSDKFVLLDPYLRLGDVMKVSSLVLSFPYTSTYKFAKQYGVKSFYYIPNKYIENFTSFGKRADCLYGIDSVNRYILDFNRGIK